MEYQSSTAGQFKQGATRIVLSFAPHGDQNRVNLRAFCVNVERAEQFDAVEHRLAAHCGRGDAG